MSDAELVRRVENLERDNRRLKAFTFGILVLAVALGGIYAARPPRETRQFPKIVTAQGFWVVDSSGKARIKIGPGSDFPGIGITFYDAQGLVQARILGDELGAGPIIELYGGDAAVSMGVLSGEPGINLKSSPNDHAPMADRLALSVAISGEPRISLQGPEGYSMDLGATHTVTPTTGEKQRRSAASIVMFGSDKDHHVIWSAP